MVGHEKVRQVTFAFVFQGQANPFLQNRSIETSHLERNFEREISLAISLKRESRSFISLKLFLIKCIFLPQNKSTSEGYPSRWCHLTL